MELHESIAANIRASCALSGLDFNLLLSRALGITVSGFPFARFQNGVSNKYEVSHKSNRPPGFPYQIVILK